ncbi:hypothetical protein [Enterococcus plantarum]|uniref:hypothetical protein n=1 Tax=Enterococcus TaxID=1350 RepID=UPI0011B47611|nr:hypothetical protein [Enterococcus plantarum]
MTNKDRQLTDELKKNVILADLGDQEAKAKIADIWGVFSTTDFLDKCDPIIVIYPDGESEIYRSKIKTIEACKIAHKTLQNCIETGSPDRMGRCYDYVIR